MGMFHKQIPCPTIIPKAYQTGTCLWNNSVKFSIKNLMIAMRTYQVIISYEVISELEAVAKYIASIYRPESGHNYVNRVLGQLAALSYSADAYQFSRFALAKAIHPKAKTLTIINHKWTVVFHIDGDYVIVDRIIASKSMY
jgi:hypothetical protein